MLVQPPPATTMAMQSMDENPREQPKRPTKVTLNASEFLRHFRAEQQASNRRHKFTGFSLPRLPLCLGYGRPGWEVQMCGFLPAPLSPHWAISTRPQDTAFFPLTCQMLETAHSRNDNSSSSIIPDEFAHVRNALIELTSATITNEIREAAPRLRLVGAFPP
jgi:hypothetical protein